MNEIKLSLTITIPGRVLFSEQECSKQLKKVITKNGRKKTITKTVEDWSKMDSHTIVVDKEKITFHTRKTRQARQTINMSKEAYLNMIDKNACPSWITAFKWANMKKEQRLQAHLHKVCESLGGSDFSYVVFED